ncbi:SigE family RNA polymerase sigma factor [Nocardioidaceae bacterium]|nr:SigE family RNA polymerase sigma factor [Nocardioidaceae bacterium]
MRADLRESFGAYVTARRDHLLRTAYLLCGDHAQAEDLVQAALVSAASRWSRLADDPEAYVRRSIVNQHVSWWRRHRGRTCTVAEVPGTAHAAGGQDETQRIEDSLSLAAALSALAPRQRAVVVLRFFEDLDVAATAEALGCSTGTVKSQTSDALRRLRSLLPALAPELVPEPKGRT